MLHMCEETSQATQQPELRELGEPLKIDLPLEAPPGLSSCRTTPSSMDKQLALSDEYSIGEAVLALRSNGTWSPATVADITSDRLTIALRNGLGVKHVRKKLAHQLLKKAEPQKVQSTQQETQASKEPASQIQDERIKDSPRRLASMSLCKPLGILHAKMLDTIAARKAYSGSMQAWKIAEETEEDMCKDDVSLATSAVSTASGGSDCFSISISSTSDDGCESTEERTTVMLRNIPNNLSRDQVLAILNTEGFGAEYNLFYLPVDCRSKVGLGYAFINFVSHDLAESFIEHFTCFRNWKTQSEKVGTAVWSNPMQGLDEHIKRYRDSPVMHDSVPDEFKPVLFQDGLRVPFPKPTKRIRAPRPLGSQ